MDWQGSSPRTRTLNHYYNTRFSDFGTEQKNVRRMRNTALVPSSSSVDAFTLEFAY